MQHDTTTTDQRTTINADDTSALRGRIARLEARLTAARAGEADALECIVRLDKRLRGYS